MTADATTGTELYRRSMAQYTPELSDLMLKVWSPTPWMVDVITDGREQEIWQWCYRAFGPESSPIHGKVGNWHRANVTIHGKTWFGFKTEAMMQRFQEQFPSVLNSILDEELRNKSQETADHSARSTNTV
jgi:hypothetical protein